jgi:hypothetical protein
MTDIFEGSVIRLARRLDEFLNQVCSKSSFGIFFFLKPWQRLPSIISFYLGFFYVAYTLLFKCSTIMCKFLLVLV